MLSTNYVQMIYHRFRPEQRRAHLSHRPDWPVKRWRLINTDRWRCEEAAQPIRERRPGLSSPPLTSIQCAAERHCCSSSAQNENKVLSQRRLITLTEQTRSSNVFLISNHKHFNSIIITNGLEDDLQRLNSRSDNGFRQMSWCQRAKNDPQHRCARFIYNHNSSSCRDGDHLNVTSFRRFTEPTLMLAERIRIVVDTKPRPLSLWAGLSST